MQKTRKTKSKKIICFAVLFLAFSLSAASAGEKKFRVVLGLGGFYAIEDNFGFEGFPFMLSLGLTPFKGITIDANTLGVGLYSGNLIADFFEFFDVYDFSLFVTCGLSMGIFGHTGTNVGGGLKIRLYKRIAFRFEIRSFDVGSSYRKTSLIALRILL